MQEFPAIQRVQQNYAAKGLTVLAITSDEVASIRSVRSKQKATFTFLRDPEDKVSEAYGVSGIPQLFIVDQGGQLIVDHRGYRGGLERDLRTILTELLIQTP
jgi:peroxiredoxin